jgi:hypothetical protein
MTFNTLTPQKKIQYFEKYMLSLIAELETFSKFYKGKTEYQLLQAMIIDEVKQVNSRISKIKVFTEQKKKSKKTIKFVEEEVGKLFTENVFPSRMNEAEI